MGELPVGTVTFVFTDVVGSTALWEQAADGMGPAMTRHDELVEGAVVSTGGMLVRPRGEGDSRFAVYGRASDALNGAVAIQKALTAEQWNTPKPIVVRISVHTGEADLRAGDYYGSAVNRCARLRSLAHPGQILVSQATADVAGGAMALRDLGTHRLKDLAAPEHVHQVEHPDVRSDFPPLVSIDVVPNNLPLHVSDLVGRDAELGDVVGRVEASRLVTLRGPGGTGKSRLALAAAAELTGQFPDGVWFVELAPISSAEIVAPTVASVAADIDDVGDVTDALARALKDKRTLLVVDNCEHVIDAAAKLIENLLRQTSNVRVLATSQEPLRIYGEHVVAVGPLAPDEAVELFVERARATNPSFALDDATLDAVRAICTRLDGIPLAVELAATRTTSMSAVQISERLDDRFRLLTGGSRSAPERHRTLGAALEWTHDLLNEPEQILYRRLGVFTGGATLEAIEAVCTAVDGIDPFDLYDLLQSLVDRSLLVLDANHDPARYRMLETVLAHARGKLAPDEHHALRDHHLAYFAARATLGKKGMRSSDLGGWLARLSADHDNVRAALAWSLDGGNSLTGLQLAAETLLFWHKTGGLSEAGRWLDILLEASPPDAGPERANALISRGWVHAMRGSDVDAQEFARRAGVMAEGIADRKLQAAAYELLSGSLFDTSAGSEGVAELKRAVELYVEVGDDERANKCGQGLGEQLFELGRPAEALPFLEAADTYARAHGHVVELAANVIYGVAYLDLGDPERAIAIARGRSDMIRETGDQSTALLTEIGEAQCLAAVGERREAAALLARAAASVVEYELDVARDGVVLTAASVLVPTDPRLAAWLTAAIVGAAEEDGRRFFPRDSRRIFQIETAARAALGDDYDSVCREGRRSSLDEVDALLLDALHALADTPGGADV